MRTWTSIFQYVYIFTQPVLVYTTLQLHTINQNKVHVNITSNSRIIGFIAFNLVGLKLNIPIFFFSWSEAPSSRPGSVTYLLTYSLTGEKLNLCLPGMMTVLPGPSHLASHLTNYHLPTYLLPTYLMTCYLPT